MINIEYQAIEVSWDQKLLGRRSGPQTVKILTQAFDEYMRENNSDTFMHIRNLDWLYDRIPLPLIGRFLYKDDSWDYMSAIYFRFGMIAAVSQKVKIILEDLNVSQDEYVLKPISVEGSDRQIYLLFIKTISDAELIYPESTFNVDESESMMHFSSYNERAMVPDGCGVRDIFLPESYRNRDIINLQSSVPVFFSQRLVDAFEKNNIKGFAVVKNCKSTLNFI